MLTSSTNLLQSFWQNEVLLSITAEQTYASLPGEKIFVIPTRVLVELPSYKVVAFGHEARPVEHAGVRQAKVIAPCSSTEIFDQTATTVYLRAVMQMLLGRAFLLRPRVLLSQFSQVTPFMQELWQVCLYQAGAREVVFVHPLLAIAAGAGLPVADARGYALGRWDEDRLLLGLVAFGHVQSEQEFVVPLNLSGTQTAQQFEQAWQQFLQRLPTEFQTTVGHDGVVISRENDDPQLAARLSKAVHSPVTLVPRSTEVLGLQKYVPL